MSNTHVERTEAGTLRKGIARLGESSVAAWLIVALLVGGVAAVTYVFLGPPSAPAPQIIGSAEITIVGLDMNPLYGNLLRWSYWHATVIENRYNITESMRPLVTIAGLPACAHVGLQVSLDGNVWSANLTPEAPTTCVYDTGGTMDVSVGAHVTGTTWYFRHVYNNVDSFSGATAEFTVQLIQ